MHLLLLLVGMTAVGFVLGVFYYYVLWVILKSVSSQKGWGWRMIAGFIIRVVLVSGFIFLLIGHDFRMLTSLVGGFFVARFYMPRWIHIHAGDNQPDQ